MKTAIISSKTSVNHLTGDGHPEQPKRIIAITERLKKNKSLIWDKPVSFDEKIRTLSNKLIDKTLELEGTITGEHGIGLHKKSYLLKEHGDNIPLMKSIKRSIDSNNIMNPGKIFDLN